jgi:Amt family ammonium transporter
MSSYSSISLKKILPVLLICLTVMLIGGAAPFVQDVVAQAPAAAAPEAPAAPAPLKVDTGDTAWILASSALVMAMTLPGLALFYGGLTRQKNILSTVLHSFICLCLASIAWVLFGYSLSFGPDVGGFIGNFDWAWLRGVGAEPHPVYGPTIPHEVFMMYQMMFAAITPALMTGAIAERIRFSSMLWFLGIWSIVVYYPVCHWIWGGGWLGQMGALDFAGGAVVHVSSATSALVACIMLGKRMGYPTTPMPPHNLPIMLLGAGLLWFGWFGFNAGSALGANGLAASAFVATHIAASVATVVWMLIEWAHRGKPTALGCATGAIAGLATITPAAGFVGLGGAIIIGIAAGVICYICVSILKPALGFDDSLDVVGVHGVGGAIGLVGAGLFASKLVNSAGQDGLFYGNPKQLMVQLIMIGAVAGFSMICTWIILKIIDVVMGLRVTKDEEQEGLDVSQHGEKAYHV